MCGRLLFYLANGVDSESDFFWYVLKGGQILIYMSFADAVCRISPYLINIIADIYFLAHGHMDVVFINDLRKVVSTSRLFLCNGH